MLVRNGARVVQELVVVEGLEFRALVHRKHDDASDAKKYPRRFGHAMDAQVQSFHPGRQRKNVQCSYLLVTKTKHSKRLNQ